MGQKPVPDCGTKGVKRNQQKINALLRFSGAGMVGNPGIVGLMGNCKNYPG
jgi:hypothetical protein